MKWGCLKKWMRNCLPAIVVLSAASAQSLDLAGVEERHIQIPMRDGVRLSAYLYLPPGQGPWPVLYEQRYADLRGTGSRRNYARLAAQGYAVVAESFRGSQLSEGTFDGYRALGWGKLRDGYDSVEWLARQPWSNGKIGTFGGSQAGYAQNFLAVTRPPHLVAQYMTDTGLSLFHLGYRIGGTTRPRRFLQMLEVCRDPRDGLRWLEETLEHPTYDAYWEAEDCRLHFGEMNVPSFEVGSWYDFMSVGSIESFIGRQHQGGPQSKGKQQMVLGPWAHGGTKVTLRVGDLEYPENSRFDLFAHMVRWFDYYLKGKPTGVDRDPAVRYYVMGAVGEPGAPGNVWRTARDWPVPAADQSYYLHEGGSLSTSAPDLESSATGFRSDPEMPAPIPGRAFPGARDSRAYEHHPDVRTFTSEPLAAPVEWTGKVRAELWVSSSARDSDFIARVCDVYPDGRSILMVDSILRARYRDGFEKEVLMKPGEIYPLRFDLGWLSQIFAKGHRIRVTVAGTGADFYEPNPNTGERFTIGPPARVVVANNRVFHDRQRASRIIAPVASVH
jgi:predicted acyl esterase